ncbi:uncharacterized protein LOC114416622 [Glycine soja]|uniref:Protein POLAR LOCALIZATION DURING ASYMMETRIC DIVISION AND REDISTRIBUTION n=1 Tax=Glycine soja TaxID=3848 RepID=A0A0B2Q9A9_GLYSO|nr:uncharacterized protein LOC114416622 [Glycine soja]KHN17825.1 hypothetical protein glysoja_029133 [Glycine soja]RZC08451.1 hypothetical protein D0Y65_015252 [Glycine soja]
MDLWVVAAAAGAGYLAKYWNRISKNGDGSCHMALEDSCFENPGPPSCSSPFTKQARRDEFGNDFCYDGRALEGKSSDLNTMDGLLTGEVASTRGIDGEKLRHFRNYNKHDVLSLSNLAMPLSPYDDVDDGNEQSSGFVGDHGFLFPDSSAEVVPINNSSGHKTFLKMKHLSGRANRPLSSLESCFMAQLYKEHAETEEYVFSSLSSPSTATRSFLVSNGSQIINRANNNLFSVPIGSKEYKLQKEAGQVKDENVFGVSSLPKIISVNDTKETFNAVIGRSRRLSSSDNVSSGKIIRTQQFDKTFLFSLGISFGMITSIMANKREIDKLRELLKQNENLVQDLQEELEMKDSMTVKELQNENYGSLDTLDHSSYDKELNEFSPEKHVDNSPRIDSKESYHQKVEQSSESMSKIEAELEAELERLGLDMNASSLEGKLSELVELDPEFVADFSQGELRADMVSGKDSLHPKSNEDAGDATPLPANYAVLPHELSLRLHEVIQSQLEQRVKELEIALENSQRKVQLFESKQESYLQKASSFSKENDDCDLMSQPLILNLSGEALDAYNEAYEELIKINDSEENSPLGIHDSSDHQEDSHANDWHALGVQHGGANGSSKVTMMEGSIYELDGTADETCGFDDTEVEQQLIRQIVERTKKGSPVFKNAQRILYSVYEDEQ